MAESSEHKSFPIGKIVFGVLLVLVVALAIIFAPMLRDLIGNQGQAPPPSDQVENAPAPDNAVTDMPGPDNTVRDVPAEDAVPGDRQ